MPYPRLQWLFVSAVCTQHSTRSSDVIAQVSDRAGTASLTCFKLLRLPFPHLELQVSKTPVSITNCWRSQLETQVLFTWPVSSSLSSLMRPKRCDSFRASASAALLVAPLRVGRVPSQPLLGTMVLLAARPDPRRASQRSRTQLSVCSTARTREFITLLAPCNMLVLVVHSRVAARLVATGNVAHGVRRLGAVLAESGLCREVGKFRCAATFAHALLASRRPYCKCCGVQFCTRVRNAGTRFCGVLQRERESEDHGACVVTGGWR